MLTRSDVAATVRPKFLTNRRLGANPLALSGELALTELRVRVLLLVLIVELTPV